MSFSAANTSSCLKKLLSSCGIKDGQKWTCVTASVPSIPLSNSGCRCCTSST